MLHMYVSYVNAQIWKNDAYAHVMQVQLCKANTWSVTLRPRPITELSKKFHSPGAMHGHYLVYKKYTRHTYIVICFIIPSSYNCT
jgi:hypothetical protein